MDKFYYKNNEALLNPDSPIWIQENSLKKSERLSEKSNHNIKDCDYMSNNQRRTSKILEATLLFVDFSKSFDSIHREMMDLILLVCSHTK